MSTDYTDKTKATADSIGFPEFKSICANLRNPRSLVSYARYFESSRFIRR